MKEIVKLEQEFGGDGATAKACLGVEQSTLKLELSLCYPIEKLVAPISNGVDKALDALESAIPGDWDKPFVEQFKKQIKDEIVKQLSE